MLNEAFIKLNDDINGNPKINILSFYFSPIHMYGLCENVMINHNLIKHFHAWKNPQEYLFTYCDYWVIGLANLSTDLRNKYNVCVCLIWVM